MGQYAGMIGQIAGGAATAVYTAYTQKKAADEQRAQLEVQKKQIERNALAEKEQTTKAAQTATEQVRRQGLEVSAAQNVAAASSGLQLSADTSFGLIKEQTATDYSKAITDINYSLETNLGNINRGLNNQLQTLENAKNQIATDKEIATNWAIQNSTLGLNVATSAASSSASNNLLEKKYSNQPASPYITQVQDTNYVETSSANSDNSSWFY